MHSLLPQLSPALFIAPKSQIIIGTGSCLLFKKPATKCISMSATRKPEDHRDRFGKEDSLWFSRGLLRSLAGSALNQ